MNSEDPIGIVELGNLNLKCSVFKVEEDTVEVMSTSVAPSDGIHNDIIINLSRATNAIRSCISDAEKKAKISLKKINLVFEQPDFLCTRFSKHKKIDRSQIHIASSIGVSFQTIFYYYLVHFSIDTKRLKLRFHSMHRQIMINCSEQIDTLL